MPSSIIHGFAQFHGQILAIIFNVFHIYRFITLQIYKINLRTLYSIQSELFIWPSSLSLTVPEAAKILPFFSSQISKVVFYYLYQLLFSFVWNKMILSVLRWSITTRTMWLLQQCTMKKMQTVCKEHKHLLTSKAYYRLDLTHDLSFTNARVYHFCGF